MKEKKEKRKEKKEPSYYFDDAAKARIKEELTPLRVCQEYGIPMRKIGSAYSIKCPLHNDEHFGSCNITHDGTFCKCYVCGVTFDCFRLIAVHKGLDPERDFYEIVKEAAGMLGILEEYRSSSGGAPRRPKTRYRVLDMQERKLIGLTGGRNVKVETGMSLLKPTDGTPYFTVDDEENGEIYVLQKTIHQDFFRELAEDDPETYREMVRDHALDTVDQKFKLMADFSVLHDELLPDIRKAGDLYKEFGGDPDRLLELQQAYVDGPRNRLGWFLEFCLKRAEKNQAERLYWERYRQKHRLG